MFFKLRFFSALFYSSTGCLLIACEVQLRLCNGLEMRRHMNDSALHLWCAKVLQLNAFGDFFFNLKCNFSLQLYLPIVLCSSYLFSKRNENIDFSTK